MEINKNVNKGKIDSRGGNINMQFGDIYEGLPPLLEEYKYQLNEIEKLLNEFKPKTALQQLEKLEGRINSSSLKIDNITSSKILFIKALCQNYLDEFPKETSAQNFIKAYKKDSNNQKLRTRACIEYLNVSDFDKAIELAEKIITDDEYNIGAWFVKTVTTPNEKLKESIKNIPEIVRQNDNFRYSIFYHLLIINQSDNRFDTLEDIENEYNITLNINFNDFQELRFENLDAWKIIIDLASSLVFNEYAFILKQISESQDLQIEANNTINSTLNLLNIFINTLEGSEIDSYHQKFLYNFFNYIIINNKEYVNELENIYKIYYSNKLEWFPIYLLCKVLINEREYLKGLDIIITYEEKNKTLLHDLYYLKLILTFLSNRNEDLIELFDNHLNNNKIIDEKVGLNILSSFIPFFYRRKIDLKPQVNKLLNSKFHPEELKDLLEYSITLKSEQDFDKEFIYQKLLILKNSPNFSHIGKNLIVQNLAFIGKIKDAINLLNSYIDKSQISHSLYLYIELVYQQLSDKDDTEQGKYIELIELLKFWRINSKTIDKRLIDIESQLYVLKNDWNNVNELQEFLYLKDPDDLINFINYLISLDKLKLVDKIKELSSSIPLEFEDENIGLTFIKILIKNNIDLDKSFKILYNLAVNPENTQARKYYFINSYLFRDKFFKHYKIVKPNYWVQYELNRKIQEIKITNPRDKKYNNFLNKTIGETFTIKTNAFNTFNHIKIINIYNDHLHLYYEIVKEAKNPINSLEIYNIEAPTSPEEFNEYLKENFGEEGSSEKKEKEKYLNDYYNYRIGFTEITRIFREKYIDTYLYLTSENNQIFTTFPSLATNNIDTHNAFILDFSTLILFYQLEKELDFQFKHKYILSYLVKENIEEIILEEKNSPKVELSVQITNEKVIPYFFPENYNQLRMDFFESLLEWINNNCIIDLVEEKLDTAFKLEKNNKKFGKFMKVFIDSMYLSTRHKANLISSDSSLFLFLKQSNQQGNIINPEKYLNYFYPEKCNTQFYRYLLKSNYLGININFEVLKNEFYDYILLKENYYIKCLENLQFSVNGNPQIIKTVCDFVKELYLINSIQIKEKNRYAFEVFKHALYRMPSELVLKLLNNLEKEFKLLGDYHIQVLTTFKSCVDFYKGK